MSNCSGCLYMHMSNGSRCLYMHMSNCSRCLYMHMSNYSGCLYMHMSNYSGCLYKRMSNCSRCLYMHMPNGSRWAYLHEGAPNKGDAFHAVHVDDDHHLLFISGTGGQVDIHRAAASLTNQLHPEIVSSSPHLHFTRSAIMQSALHHKFYTNVVLAKFNILVIICYYTTP